MTNEKRLTPAVLALSMVFALAQRVPAQGQAATIDVITPKTARYGDTVTISGRGFGGSNIFVTVGGVSAALLTANGNQATFSVPSTAPPGITLVTVTNPGGRTGSIAFRVLEGILLPGRPADSALAAAFDIAPVGVDASLIQNGVFLTRIDVTFARDATVGQVNDALLKVDGGIVSMAKGFPFVTIAVPQQPSLAALEGLAQKLRSSPGILFAFVGHAASTTVLPVAPSSFQDRHLLPTRFPAAWNAMQLALRNCASQPKLPIVVADNFQAPNTLGPNFSGFSQQVPGFQLFPAGDTNGTQPHGYDVTTTLAALFDSNTPTGANPFTNCLDVTGVQVGGVTTYQLVDRIRQSFPASGPFLLNFSLAFDPECCPTAPLFTVIPALERASEAVAWAEMTFGRWRDFLGAASAGNWNTDKVGQIYPGYKSAKYSSPLTVAASTDLAFNFITDSSLWNPVDTLPNGDPAPDLTATQLDKLGFLGLITAPFPENNLLITGSTTQGATFNDLVTSGFSNAGADLSAVGEGVVEPGGSETGTSFSAPQVAGLASYLWLLSNDLRNNHPSQDTRTAILKNARTTPGADKVLDAYAAVLSLDAAALPTPAGAPVRLAILDVNNDQKFDENDLTSFLSHYRDSGGAPVEPSARDYSRFDLNGDGFTGGSRTEAFDLDRIGSTQYGLTHYAPGVTQQIEGQTVNFNSLAATDLQILCYYAYSSLFTGDTDARKSLMTGCTVTVDISPKTITLAPGGTQQFGATVHGSNNPLVTWSATGGTITTTGFYTAVAGGPFKVRATSVANVNAFDEATVTVTSANGLAGITIVTGNHPGMIDLFVQPTFGGSFTITSSPIGDIPGFLTKLNTALTGVTEIGEFGVQINEAVTLGLNLAMPVGDITVSGNACASNITVTTGDVRANHTLNAGTQGLAFISGCLANLHVTVGDVHTAEVSGPSAPALNSHVNMTAHNIDAVFLGCAAGGCGQIQSSVVNIQAVNIGYLSLANSSGSTITVGGSIHSSTLVSGVDIESNVNLTLGAPLIYGDVRWVFVTNNTFASTPQLSIGNEVAAFDPNTSNLGRVFIQGNTGLSLGGISLGSIAGNLSITNNHGFTDADAHTFANGHSVAGTVTISGNLP